MGERIGIKSIDGKKYIEFSYGGRIFIDIYDIHKTNYNDKLAGIIIEEEDMGKIVNFLIDHFISKEAT